MVSIEQHSSPAALTITQWNRCIMHLQPDSLFFAAMLEHDWHGH
jgi:hypothetical protein